MEKEMKRLTALNPEHHFSDIHQIAPEEEKCLGVWEEEQQQRGSGNRATRLKEQMTKRTNWSLSRQVSLETGFSVLNRDSSKGNKNRRRSVLDRNGKSFAGFPMDQSHSGEVRKKDFSVFRTRSIQKQMTMLPVRKDSTGVGAGDGQRSAGGSDEAANQSVPNVGRYYAALRGPELDRVREHEDIILPTDELWPFLLRFPINCFGISLGLGSQCILWGALATSPATRFLHISPDINIFIWFLALAIFAAVFATYALKCAFYFEAVRREFYHPVRVNFFFAPWIVCMFLAIGAPPRFHPSPMSPAVWCAFMAPVVVLELKIYGQWLSGGKRRISRVVNPSSHLSVVGNFVGAILACKVGWKEPAKFFWAVGLAHYLVVFVTLYQRLPSSEALPKELHPVYSMFIAAPSAASIAWGAIYGKFDGVSTTFYFIALFLYLSLVVRVGFFWGFRFSVAWWAYTFPMTTATVATIKYAEAVPHVITKGLVIVLSVLSTTMVSVLVVSTFIHAFALHSLFPNDPAIAISEKKSSSNITNKNPSKNPKKISKRSSNNNNCISYPPNLTLNEIHPVSS